LWPTLTAAVRDKSLNSMELTGLRFNNTATTEKHSGVHADIIHIT